MNIQYFIVGHDPSLYKHIENYPYTFLCVGKYKQNYAFDNIIYCHQLINNIEKYPYLCAFTAWYAVVHNNLFSLNHVSILEYDHISSTRLDDTNHELLTTNPNAVIAYSNTLTNHYVFTKSTPWLEIALKKVYNIDLSKFILQYGKKFPVWPTTTNITMPVSVLINFVNWFEPMTHVFREYPLGAYVHERAFFIFCVINNIEILFANNIIFHEQKQSHGIYDIYGAFLHKHQTHYLHSNMKYEYDIVYNNELQQAIMSLNL